MNKLITLTLLAILIAACGSPAAESPAANTGGETPAPVILAAGQCVEMIANGDFEAASIEPWVPSADILAFTSNANNGSQAVSLGEDTQLYQELTIHSGANRAELSYWWGTTQAAGSLTVTLQDTNGNVLKSLGEYIGAANMELSVSTADVSDYIGQTVRLVFETTAG
jgi:hypothetical protein